MARMTLVVGLCCALLWTFGVAAQLPKTDPETGAKIQLGFRYWFSNAGAKSNVIRDLGGNELNVVDKLGVGDVGVPEGWVQWWFLPRHSLRLSYMDVGFDGNKVVTSPLSFDGETVGLFNRVKVDADVKTLRLGWRWCVAGSEDSTWKLETIVDAAGYQVKANLKDYLPLWPFSPADKENLHATVGLPLLGLSLGLKPLDWLGFFAEGSGMYAGNYGYLVDTLGGVSLSPLKWLSFQAGYRYFNVKGEAHHENAQVDLLGPFVGATLQF